MKPKIIIIGAGGHGKVVLDAILAQNIYDVVGFADDGVEVGTSVTKNFKNVSSIKNTEYLTTIADYFVMGIGSNEIRKKLFNSLKENLEPATIIHPSAIIGTEVQILSGTVILANAIINAHSVIGENTIVNSAVIVDHECNIGNHVHLSIGSIIGSNSVVADHIKTTVGQIVIPFSKLEEL